MRTGPFTHIRISGYLVVYNLGRSHRNSTSSRRHVVFFFVSLLLPLFVGCQLSVLLCSACVFPIMAGQMMIGVQSCNTRSTIPMDVIELHKKMRSDRRLQNENEKIDDER